MLRTAMLLALFAGPTAAWAGFSLDETGSMATTAAPAKAVTKPVSIPSDFAAEEIDLPGDDVVVRANTAPAESWIVSPSDGTLRRVLAKWAARAGWQIHWEASVDLPVTVTASFEGDFRSAVKGLFSSLSASEVNLSALLYTGNRVIRVTESGQRAQ